MTYATNVTATQQQTIKVEYQINRKASMSTSRDQNGGFSFEPVSARSGESTYLGVARVLQPRH